MQMIFCGVVLLLLRFGAFTINMHSNRQRAPKIEGRGRPIVAEGERQQLYLALDSQPDRDSLTRAILRL